MYVDEKILNQFFSIREVFKDVPIRRLISEEDRIDLIKREKTEFIDCIEREKVLDDKNIITVQTKEYGSIEVIPVDTVADIESVDVQLINSLVKIEERVPDVSGNYLCYLATGEFEVLYFDREIEDSEYNFAYPFGVWKTYPSKDGGECREWIEVLEATHWQPLPKPPKEGDANERS